jgi:hypothetical protein
LIDVEGLSGLVANLLQQGRMWIDFPFLCTLRISCYAVRNYVIWCANKELRDVFGNVFFITSEMWPSALLDTYRQLMFWFWKPVGGVFFACLL